MTGAIITAIVFGSIVSVVGLICGTILVILRMRRGGGGTGDTEEARMIQEMYTGLEKMEKRIEALETILMDREEDRDSYGDTR